MNEQPCIFGLARDDWVRLLHGCRHLGCGCHCLWAAGRQLPEDPHSCLHSDQIDPHRQFHTQDSLRHHSFWEGPGLALPSLPCTSAIFGAPDLWGGLRSGAFFSPGIWKFRRANPGEALRLWQFWRGKIGGCVCIDICWFFTSLQDST